MSRITFWLVVIFLLLGNPPASGKTPALPEGASACLACHSNPEMSKSLPKGETMSLFINPNVYASSIHGDKLNCTDCHSEITGFPHPERRYESRRAYSLARYESCKRCHFANYTKTLESVHYALLSKGDLKAPVCTDCHGAHDVTFPQMRSVRISQSCFKCHSEIYETYIDSVHGMALVDEGNLDVPTCTDCHTTHTMADPRTQAFHLGTPDLCGQCHQNEKLMKKYGLSTKVVKTYLKDFHGVSVSFYKRQKADISTFTAVCTDCHGVHDITKTDAPNSPVMKANLVKTCRKCHPDAKENFPTAWLSHYEPSWKKAPLVYLVKLFYVIFIPFVVGGLTLQILLHVWRAATNR